MSIQHNLEKIRQLIVQAELACKRKPGSVLLLAVSKQQNIEAILEAHQSGVMDFGENYFQEAQPKIKALTHLPIHWHFIGPIQSNKTKGIARSFNWVHSIDRDKIACLLNEYRPMDQPPLNVCLQINLVGEDTKSGIAPESAADLARLVSELPQLRLRGLMTIPPPQQNEQEQYELLMQLNRLMHSLNSQLNIQMDTLSMGMSDDLIPAIKAGATIVRIGRAIFGDRKGKTV